MKFIILVIKALLIYLLFILPKTILGQDALSGIVLDTADNPIDNVLITAQTQKDHQLTLKQTRTNQKGEFNLPITTSTTSVVFQKQGYMTVGFNRGQLNKLLVATHLSVTLPIASQRQLADVTVKSRPPLIEHQLDKVILKVAGSSIEDIGSSLDLLKYGPGIALIDGHIFLNGNQSPEILINGKKLQLTGAARISFLNSLKSSDIEAIEIMAYPPVSFDAAGSGGLINIRLKKKLQQGLTGSLSFRGYQGLGGYPDYTPSVNLSYNKKKFGLQMGVTHDYFKAYFDVGTKRSVVDHSGTGQYSSLAKNIRKVLLESQNLSLFYNLNKHALLGIDLMHTITGGSTITAANSTLKYPESLHNQNGLGHYLEKFHKNFTDLSGNYIYRPDSLGSAFRILSDLALSQDRNFSISNSSYFDDQQNNLKDTSFITHYPSRSIIYTLQSDYKKMLPNARSLFIGFKYTNTGISNNNYGEARLHHEFVLDSSTAFKFKYSEQILAGFLELKGQVAAISYQLGLRGEYSHITGSIYNSLHQDSRHSKAYFNLFPAVFLKKITSQKANNYLMARFSRRIKRPSDYQLNPFQYAIDNYTTSSGNPYLKPQYTNAVVLSYTWHNKIDFSLNYTNTTSMISPITSYYTNSAKMSRTYQNIGQSDNIYIMITIPIAICSWWQSNNTINTGLNATSSNLFFLKKYYISAALNQDFTLSKTASLNLFGSYRYHQMWANTLYDPNWQVDISFRKKILDGKLVMSLGIDDLLNTYGKSKSRQFFNKNLLLNKRTFQSREIKLSINYRLEIGKQFLHHTIERSNTAEQGRL